MGIYDKANSVFNRHAKRVWVIGPRRCKIGRMQIKCYYQLAYGIGDYIVEVYWDNQLVFSGFRETGFPSINIGECWVNEHIPGEWEARLDELSVNNQEVRTP